MSIEQSLIEFIEDELSWFSDDPMKPSDDDLSIYTSVAAVNSAIKFYKKCLSDITVTVDTVPIEQTTIPNYYFTYSTDYNTNKMEGTNP